jgi:hypothetical protein
VINLSHISVLSFHPFFGYIIEKPIIQFLSEPFEILPNFHLKIVDILLEERGINVMDKVIRRQSNLFILFFAVFIILTNSFPLRILSFEKVCSNYLDM